MPRFPRLFCRTAADTPPGYTRLDVQLLRWILLCIGTLGATAGLMMCGVFDALALEHIRLLGGHPFYIEAESAQVSLLPPAGIFAICTGITLYLSVVLLRNPGLAKRTQICFLAALATLLPGLLCILWNGVLYMAAPLFCVLLLWVLAALLPAIVCRFAKS